MKIAILSTIYPFRGGIAQFNGAMYHSLSERHTVNAYTFTRQYPGFLYPGESQYVTEGDKVESVPSIPILDSVNPLTYFTAASKIKAFQPDLMIMKFWLPFLAPSLGTVAAQVKGRTKVITIVDNAIPHEKRFMDLPLTKYFLQQNHGFIAMSEKVKEDIISLKKSAKVLVLNHPLYDHFGAPIDKGEARRLLNLPADKKILLYFGYVRDYKGLDILIESMRSLSNEYHLVLAGESYGDFTKYLDMIELHKVTSSITVINRYIPDEEVTQLFSAADLGVLSYKSATQSGVTAIAMHFELPLVVTNVGGLKEMVKHGETGLIAETPDPVLIATRIQEFFTEYSNVDFSANIRLLKDDLSWKKFGDRLIDFSHSL